MVGIALVILGVAIVNHPRAEPSGVEAVDEEPLSVVPPTPPTAHSAPFPADRPRYPDPFS